MRESHLFIKRVQKSTGHTRQALFLWLSKMECNDNDAMRYANILMRLQLHLSEYSIYISAVIRYTFQQFPRLLYHFHEKKKNRAIKVTKSVVAVMNFHFNWPFAHCHSDPINYITQWRSPYSRKIYFSSKQKCRAQITMHGKCPQYSMSHIFYLINSEWLTFSFSLIF